MKLKIAEFLFLRSIIIALFSLTIGVSNAVGSTFLNSDSTTRKNPSYNWFIRKQFLPVNYHWLSFGVEEGIINNSNINRAIQLRLSSGRYIDLSNFIQLSASFGWMFLKESSSFNKQIDGNIKLYDISLEFKSYLPSYIPGIMQYFLLGFGMDCALFKYKTPVELEYYEYPYEGTIIEKVNEDHFTAFNIHAGFGFNLAEFNDYRICLEISPGYMFPSAETYTGMENFLLKKSFYIKLKLAVYFPYGEL